MWQEDPNLGLNNYLRRNMTSNVGNEIKCKSQLSTGFIVIYINSKSFCPKLLLIPDK